MRRLVISLLGLFLVSCGSGENFRVDIELEGDGVVLATEPTTLTSGTAHDEGRVRCPPDCGFVFDDVGSGGTLAFSAVPNSGAAFVAWELACAGESGSTCTIDLVRDRPLATVEANGQVRWTVRAVFGNAEGAPQPDTPAEDGAEGDDHSESNDSAEASVVIPDDAPRYDLELRKTVDVQADRLVFTLTVVNHGPGNARGGVVHDCLPNGLVFRDRGNAGRSDPYDPSVCEWPVGEVAAGETRSIEIHTTRPTGDFLNEAALVAGLDRDTNPANDTVSLIAVVP